MSVWGKNTLSASEKSKLRQDREWLVRTYGAKRNLACAQTGPAVNPARRNLACAKLGPALRNAKSTYHALGHTGDSRTKQLVRSSDHINIKREKKADAIKETIAWMAKNPPASAGGWITLTDKRGYRIGTWRGSGGKWETTMDPKPKSKSKRNLAGAKTGPAVNPARKKRKRNAPTSQPRRAFSGGFSSAEVKRNFWKLNEDLL